MTTPITAPRSGCSSSSDTAATGLRVAEPGGQPVGVGLVVDAGEGRVARDVRRDDLPHQPRAGDHRDRAPPAVHDGDAGQRGRAPRYRPPCHGQGVRVRIQLP